VQRRRSPRRAAASAGEDAGIALRCACHRFPRPRGHLCGLRAIPLLPTAPSLGRLRFSVDGPISLRKCAKEGTGNSSAFEELVLQTLNKFLESPVNVFLITKLYFFHRGGQSWSWEIQVHNMDWFCNQIVTHDDGERTQSGK